MDNRKTQETDSGWTRKRRIKTKYNLLATAYEEIYRDEQLEKYREVFSNLEKKSRRMGVEVGCGTGIGLEAGDEHFDQDWVGIDISIEMLQQTKRRNLLGEKQHIILADSDFIPLRGKSTDLAICITVLSRVPIPIRTIKEMRRIVRSDGIIILSVLKKDFTADRFRRLIREAGLKILRKTENKLKNKDHVFFCSGI